jgi:hypothetical protein
MHRARYILGDFFHNLISPPWWPCFFVSTKPVSLFSKRVERGTIEKRFFILKNIYKYFSSLCRTTSNTYGWLPDAMESKDLREDVRLFLEQVHFVQALNQGVNVTICKCRICIQCCNVDKITQSVECTWPLLTVGVGSATLMPSVFTIILL